MSRYVKLLGHLFVRSSIAHCHKIDGRVPKLLINYCTLDGNVVSRYPYWDSTEIKFETTVLRDQHYEKVLKIVKENTEEL